MKKKRRITRLNNEVELDLARRGMAQLHVEVDNKKIAYISGVVASRDAEADAVAAVLEHGVVQVQDGMERPGHLTPHLKSTGRLGPREYDDVAPDEVQDVLESEDLTGHHFDGTTSVAAPKP